ISCARSGRSSTHHQPARSRAGAGSMPRAASARARKGERARPPEALKSGAKKSAAGRAAKPSKPNGAVRAAPAKAAAKTARGSVAERRAEKTVQAGRTLAAPETPTLSSRGKYVYCIIESSDPLRFGPIGIGADPSDVYTVHYRNLAAVVSDA